MKKYLFLIIALLFLNTVAAQNGREQIDFRFDKEKVTKPTIQVSTKGLSPTTAFLLMDIKIAKEQNTDSNRQKIDNKEHKVKSLSEEDLIKKYNLIRQNGVLYANAFISVSENCKDGDLDKMGVIINNSTQNFYTVLLPVDKIMEIAASDLIEYIKIGEKVFPMTDNARQSANVTPVQNGQGLPQAYNGEGVVVGIIDNGFDYQHPNFYSQNGSTYRVKRVWDQNYQGTPVGSVAYGRELTTQNAILAAQTDMTNETHGTHVAGCAAGGGYGTNFKGAAPNSDIVLVSHAGSDSYTIDAITYIFQYALSVGKPCVINMSFGSYLGPHDGSTIYDQFCADICNIKEGWVLVGSAANSGSDPIHISKLITSPQLPLYSFIMFPNSQTGTTGQSMIDVWGEPNKPFVVQIAQVDIWTGQIINYTQTFSSSSTAAQYTIYDYDYYDPCYVSFSGEINYSNNKPHVSIEIDNQYQDDANVALMIAIGSEYVTTVHAWTMGRQQFGSFHSNGFPLPIQDGDTDYTTSETCGVNSTIISVGSYATRTSWTSLSGQFQSDQQTLENISYFSSHGPTVDGRTKPDISAPGQYIISSYNSFNPDYGFSNSYITNSVNANSRTFYYGAMQGTSMAAPFTAGIVALMLQRNPNLTYQQVKQYLKANAKKDAYTGNIGANGSNIWGWGKVDALKTIQNIPAVNTAVELVEDDKITIFPNPATDILTINNEQLTINSIEITDISGKIISQYQDLNGNNSIDVSHLPSGVYFLKIGNQTTKFIKK